MSGVSVTRDTFRMMALVPEDLVGVPADDEWAAWLGLMSTPTNGRTAVVLVSITVTALDTQQGAGRPGESTVESIAAKILDGHADDSALVAQFTTQGGNPAVGVRRTVTQRVNGRDVTTGQAQALVVYPGPGALGVVSGVALDPRDLDRAVALVTEIATGMTVTSAPAAA